MRVDHAPQLIGIEVAEDGHQRVAVEPEQLFDPALAGSGQLHHDRAAVVVVGAARQQVTSLVCREGVVESFDADTRSSRRRTLLSPRIEDVEFTDDSIDITFVNGDQRSLDPRDL